MSGAHASLIQAPNRNAADINAITTKIAETVSSSDKGACRRYNRAHTEWNAGLKAMHAPKGHGALLKTLISDMNDKLKEPNAAGNAA